MIYEFNEVALRAETHVVDDYDYKLSLLNKALDQSLENILRRWNVDGDSSPYYVAFSGGVDSALVLAKLIKILTTPNDFSGHLFAHTLGADIKHPDIVAAKEFWSQIGGFTHLVTLVGADTETDPYKLLMSAVRKNTRRVICCDVADELFGGYYAHQAAKNKLRALKFHMRRVVKEHLVHLTSISDMADVTVFLPYADPRVFLAASLFSPEQLVTDTKRKRPIYDLARLHGVPKTILDRRKYGLNAVGQLAKDTKPRKRRKKNHE